LNIHDNAVKSFNILFNNQFKCPNYFDSPDKIFRSVTKFSVIKFLDTSTKLFFLYIYISLKSL